MSVIVPSRAERPAKLPDFLLVLRAYAGITVVALHVYGSGIVDGASQESLLGIGSVSFSWIVSGAAHPGVYVFFVLSGYLMGKGFATQRYPSNARGALAFYWARFLRIYPLLVFYMLVVVTLGHVSGTTPGATYGAIGGILALHWSNAYDQVTGWFGHLWTIVTECQFYLTVPFLALVLPRIRSRGRAIAAIALVLVLGFAARAWVWSTLGIGSGPWTPAYADAWQGSIQQPVLMNLDLFLAGMLANGLAIPERKSITSRTLVAWFASLVAFYLVCAYVTHYALFVPQLSMRVLWALALPSASLVFAVLAIVIAETVNAGTYASKLPRPAGMALSGLANLGQLTYGIYLWHLMFLGGALPFSRTFGPLTNLFVSDVSTYALAALMALVTYRGIELPADRFKRLLRPARAPLAHRAATIS